MAVSDADGPVHPSGLARWLFVCIPAKRLWRAAPCAGAALWQALAALHRPDRIAAGQTPPVCL